MKSKAPNFGPDAVNKRGFRLGVWLITIAFCCLISSCGKFFVSNDTLVGLAVSPSNPTVQPSNTQQMIATGTYGDATTKDITSQVTWTSSSPGIATINSSGVATGVATGTSTLTASMSGKTASTTLTVSNKVVSSITLSPANSTVLRGNTTQYTATANYSDGTTANITNSATWSSGSTSIATITSTGLASGVATGTTTISASSGGVTNSTNLTVN